jgi:hypothetical protein
MIIKKLKFKRYLIKRKTNFLRNFSINENSIKESKESKINLNENEKIVNEIEDLKKEIHYLKAHYYSRNFKNVDILSFIFLSIFIWYVSLSLFWYFPLHSFLWSPHLIKVEKIDKGEKKE